MLKRHASFSLKEAIFTVVVASFIFFASPFVTAASDLGEKELSIGAENSQVEELQELLHDEGILEKEYITGSFSEQTKEAVKAFQSKHHIVPEDGIAGPYTIGALTILHEGDEGKPVETLQEELHELGYYTHNIDGIFGTHTHDAVVAFQQNAEIKVDGLAGPETFGALLQADEELNIANTSSVKNNEKQAVKSQSTTAKETSNTSVDGQTLNVSATAYTANCAGCSGVTATGVDLNANPNAKVIAVDPNVIPLGSQVHIEGYGTFTAADTGGAIQGNKIDIYMPNHQDAVNFGRRNLKVTILN